MGELCWVNSVSIEQAKTDNIHSTWLKMIHVYWIKGVGRETNDGVLSSVQNVGVDPHPTNGRVVAQGRSQRHSHVVVLILVALTGDVASCHVMNMKTQSRAR